MVSSIPDFFDSSSCSFQRTILAFHTGRPGTGAGLMSSDTLTVLSGLAFPIRTVSGPSQYVPSSSSSFYIKHKTDSTPWTPRLSFGVSCEKCLILIGYELVYRWMVYLHAIRVYHDIDDQ
jgi:hypothetical protein